MVLRAVGLLTVDINMASASLSVTVGIVVCPRARSQMCWVAARRVVAHEVTHDGRQGLARMSETPRETVRVDALAVHTDLPVTGFGGATGPFEAAVRLPLEASSETLRRCEVQVHHLAAGACPVVVQVAQPAGEMWSVATVNVASAGSLH
jgi:hypothetical protein